METNQRQTKTVLRILVLLVLLQGGSAPAQESAKPKLPEATQAHLGKGYDALKQDRYEEAAQEFRAALAADPSLTLRARFPLAVALFESHKHDEARQELELVRK